MRLRQLEKKDARLMLEWMHDKSVVRYLQTDFMNKTLDDCKAFIHASNNSSEDMHLAIVDNQDIYMGTVSLKHITQETAEFAITMRTCAMGKGYASFAMAEVIRIGLEELGLREIYWYVSSENKRAIRFYDKNGYQRSSAGICCQGG